MAKQQEEKKIELPENTDFKMLVKNFIKEVQKNPKEHNLNQDQVDALKKITKLEIKILASAVKKAAADGLYNSEVNAVVGDLDDLIKHGSTDKGFDNMIKDLTNKIYELEPPTIEILQKLSAVEIAQLKKDLHSNNKSDLHQKLSGTFHNFAESLMPIAQIVVTGAIKLAVINLVGPSIDKGLSGNMSTVGVVTEMANDIGVEIVKIMHHSNEGDHETHELQVLGSTVDIV